MPYSIPLFPDRQAVGRSTYQLRKIKRELTRMDIPEPFKSVALQRVSDFESWMKVAVIDFDDDGTILDSPDNNFALGK